jgi:hypothetical protein
MDTTDFEIKPQGSVNMIRLANQTAAPATVKVVSNLPRGGAVSPDLEVTMAPDTIHDLWLELPYFVQPNGRVLFRCSAAGVLATHLYLDKRGLAPKPKVPTF